MHPMAQQHVIDWWKHRGYNVTVLSDWSLMCVSEAALLQGNSVDLNDAIRRRLAAKWRKP